MSNTALNRSQVLLLTNKSGGDVAQGDVVIVDATTAVSFTTTTTAAYTGGSVGVVIEPNGIASNAIGLVAFGGYVPKINLSGAADLGDIFKTHSVAKQAVRHAAPFVSGDFGQVLGTGTSPAAILWNAISRSGTGTGDFSGPGSSTDGDMVVFDGAGGKTGKDGGYPGCVRIATVLLGSDAATIGFSSIPATYRAIQAVFWLRGTQNAASIWTNGRLNNDSAGNYDLIQCNSSNGNAWAVATQNGATSFSVGAIPAASAGAQYFGKVEINIEQYANTSHYKVVDVRVNCAYGTDGTSVYLALDTGLWRSTVAVNQLDIITAANFLAGSRGVLYGLT